MRNSIYLILLLFASTLSYAQETEVYQGVVQGSYQMGSEEVTIIRADQQQCVLKTAPHQNGLFAVDENVQIKLLSDKGTAEVFKQGLNSTVFATLDCDYEMGRFSGADKGVVLTCNGTCSCSLQGVLSQSGSYVKCSCNDCVMEVAFRTFSQDGETETYSLNNADRMEVETLDEFLIFAERELDANYRLSKIKVYYRGENVVVNYEYADQNGTEGTVLFNKVGGKTYRISCDGPCGCSEIYHFDTNTSSCSCEDCIMTVEEVSSSK